MCFTVAHIDFENPRELGTEVEKGFQESKSEL